MNTVEMDEDSFVITDEIRTVIITPDKFEFLGGMGGSAGLFPWGILKDGLVVMYMRRGKLTTDELAEKYPEIVNSKLAKLSLGYTLGPEKTLDRISIAASTGPRLVEHVADNKDMPKLPERRRINGLGTVVVPPEINSSISTFGRTARWT